MKKEKKYVIKKIVANIFFILFMIYILLLQNNLENIKDNVENINSHYIYNDNNCYAQTLIIKEIVNTNYVLFTLALPIIMLYLIEMSNLFFSEKEGGDK